MLLLIILWGLFAVGCCICCGIYTRSVANIEQIKKREADGEMIIGLRYNWDAPDCGEYIFMPLFIIAVVCTSFCLVDRVRMASVPAKYEALKSAVEGVREGKLESIVERKDLFKHIMDMNETIAKNKTWAGNIFIGSYYSEEVSKLEYLK